MGTIESKLLRLRLRFKTRQYGSLVPIDEHYGDHFGLISADRDDTYEDAYMGRMSMLSRYEEEESERERAAQPIYTPIHVQTVTSSIWER